MKENWYCSSAGCSSHELEVLHTGLGILLARYPESERPSCIELWISRQLRLIANHPSLPDPGLRPLYRTMAARWHAKAWRGLVNPLEQDHALFETFE